MRALLTDMSQPLARFLRATRSKCGRRLQCSAARRAIPAARSHAGAWRRIMVLGKLAKDARLHGGRSPVHHERRRGGPLRAHVVSLGGPAESRREAGRSSRACAANFRCAAPRSGSSLQSTRAQSDTCRVAWGWPYPMQARGSIPRWDSTGFCPRLACREGPTIARVHAANEATAEARSSDRRSRLHIRRRPACGGRARRADRLAEATPLKSPWAAVARRAGAAWRHAAGRCASSVRANSGVGEKRHAAASSSRCPQQ